MKSRRTVLALGASTIAASTAGCIDSIPFLGDEPMEFGSEPASVPQSVLDETGYAANGSEEVIIEETVEAGGQSQDVLVTNWQAEYDKSVDVGELDVLVDGRQQAAVFTALTTPQVTVLGRSFNPVAEMTSEELAEMVQEHYEELGISNTLARKRGQSRANRRPSASYAARHRWLPKG